LRACAALRPVSARFGVGRSLVRLWRWFLSYTFPPCLPDPGHLAVLTRPVVVRAASRPPLRFQDQAALSFAGLLRQVGGGVLSSPPGYMAPRGARAHGSSTAGWGMSPHGVTGVAIATMNAGPAWPMAAGDLRAPGVARRGVRSGNVILPPSGPMPGHRQSARNRLPASFCKRAKVCGQGTSR